MFMQAATAASRSSCGLNPSEPPTLPFIVSAVVSTRPFVTVVPYRAAVRAVVTMGACLLQGDVRRAMGSASILLRGGVSVLSHGP
jgi:hypothetical protein